MNVPILLLTTLIVVVISCVFGKADKFPVPTRLLRPLNTTFRQINNGSPPDPYRAAKRGLQLEQLSDEEPATEEILEDIRSGLQYVLQTRNKWTFAIHGTGTTAMHAVLDNMIERGDKVLLLVNGHWGQVMQNMSTRLGAQTVTLRKHPGYRFSLPEIRQQIIRHRPNIVAVVQGESSTGVHQPLDGIGDLCLRYGAYLVVDFISVAGIRPVDMDYFKVDCAIASSHKGIGGVTGLGVVSLSKRAVDRIKRRRYPPTGYQTDLRLQRAMWVPGANKVPQSISTSLLYALREALGTIAREGKENVYARHFESTHTLEEHLDTMGFPSFVKNRRDRMIGITTVHVPKHKDGRKMVEFIAKNYNIFISNGSGPTHGKILRFCTYASNADKRRINNLLKALRSALISPETEM